MVKTLSYNNRSYKCFFTSGMTRPVITMITANGVTRGVKNPVTIAKVLAAIAEEDHAEALEINESLHPAPVTLFNVWQRSDGMQLAVNAEGTASFMRPFKQASWLRAGFEANLEYYWLVEKGVTINETPKLTAYYHDGILDTAEAI
ncbi:hypothetical protein DAD08_19460 [Salmonella enterica]|nr:hypothetical protein [Salmonella enterica]